MAIPVYRRTTARACRAVAIMLRPHVAAPGVYQCIWQVPSADGPPRYGDAVLAEVDAAPPGWLPLADILLMPVHATVGRAVTAARPLARCCPGCALIAVPINDGAIVIYTAEEGVSVRRSVGGARDTAIRHYCRFLGH